MQPERTESQKQHIQLAQEYGPRFLIEITSPNNYTCRGCGRMFHQRYEWGRRVGNAHGAATSHARSHLKEDVR